MSDDQLLVRVAWLYYMEGLTQDRIGVRLRLTRLRVNRMLAEARQSGLVGVTINAKLTQCIELEDSLRRDFGLQAAVIVPTPDDVDLIPVLLGRATADFVSGQLDERPCAVLAWDGERRCARRFAMSDPRAGPNCRCTR